MLIAGSLWIGAFGGSRPEFGRAIAYWGFDVQRLLQLQRTFCNLVFTSLAFDEGHGDKGLTPNLIDLMDGTDVLMI